MNGLSWKWGRGPEGGDPLRAPVDQKAGRPREGVGEGGDQPFGKLFDARDF